MKSQKKWVVVGMCGVLLLGLTLSLWAAEAWKTKKYTEWSESDAMQVLERSPWGATVSVIIGAVPSMDDSSESTLGSRPTAQPPTDDTNSTNFMVAWYSSVPVREAQARLALLHKRANEQQVSQFLQPVTDACLITVSGAYLRPFLRMDKEKMLKGSYIQVKGKNKIYATDYTPPKPGQSNLALYQFPRTLDGKPVLTAEDKDVQFVTDLGAFRVHARFSPKKMIFDGVFTY